MTKPFKTSLEKPEPDIILDFEESELELTDELKAQIPELESDVLQLEDVPSEASLNNRRKPKPKSIGRYKIISELGRGAMAYVYKAYDPEIDRFLAVKVLREELAQDQDYRKGFIHEAKLAGQLAHPGIVTIYDVGVADDKPYIAMELLDGLPLDELLKNHQKLPLKMVLSILVQLTRALHYAHSAGVVHRDIKPGNIICLADNKNVKITDFGIAQLNDSLASTGKSQEKVLGTPEYMAPEQILGKKLDARSDLYSLGTLIQTMLTGSPPFKADDFGDLFKQIIQNKPPEISESGIKVPDELQDLIRKLLQKSPEKRYQNAYELMQDIRELSNVMGAQAKEKSRTGFVSLKLRWTLTMAAIVAITMMIGLVIVYYQQYVSLRTMAMDYGYSTAKLIAFEVAEPLLLEDNIALETIILDLKKNQDIEYISIRNLNNQVLASTNLAEVGLPFSAKTFYEFKNRVKEENDIIIDHRDVNSEHQVFDVDTSIQFNNTKIGNIQLSISVDQLMQSVKTTLAIMVVLMFITLFAVFSMTLAFARQISHQSTKITLALERVRRGQFNRRLSVEKNDEFGRIATAFNLMSESLEHKLEKKAKVLKGNASQLKARKPGTQQIKNKVDDETVVLKKD